MTPEFTNNKAKYLFHLEQFKNFSGSAASYCKIHDLRPDMLGYYKRKLPRKSSAQFVKVNVEAIVKKSASTKSAIDVDPVWLAKLIHNLVAIK